MTLPLGFRVRLAPGVHSSDHGTLLVGGSPLTALRLGGAATDYLHGGVLDVHDAGSAHVADQLLRTNLAQPDIAGLPPRASHELTVVIPVRDRAAQLERTLAALAPLACIVIDDASAFPRTIADVARHHGARVIHLPQNLGPAGARNAGLAEVTTTYVAFVDSDIEVGAADLVALTRHFADPSVAIVGPRVVGRARGPRPRWFERYDALNSSLDLGPAPGAVRPGAAVGWLPSACLVAATELVGNGFDPSLRVGEDVDLVWRTVAAGHRVRYAPDVVVAHDARSSLRGWLGRKVVYGSGGAALAARHGDRLAPAILTPMYAVAAAALLTRRPRALPVAAIGLAWGTRSVWSALPATDTRARLSASLAVRGLGWGVRQEAALLLRHWWPAAAAVAVPSRTMRRALLSAVVVDSLVVCAERRPKARDVATTLVGRRLDDLAYGSGLWFGAVRAHSTTALRPRRPGAR